MIVAILIGLSLAVGASAIDYFALLNLYPEPSEFAGAVVSKHVTEFGVGAGQWGMRYELVLVGREGVEQRVYVPQYVFNRVRPGTSIMREQDGGYSFPGFSAAETGS